MTNSLEMKFLGPPEVLLGGQPVKFATRKALALFAYLVVEGGPHPREKLMSLLWPESETRQARSALRTTLARIKESLREIDEPLQTDGDRVEFNASLVSILDLNLITQATIDTQPTKLTPAAVTLLANAVEASHGPFLDGLSLPDAPDFDKWLTVQRANWEQRQNLVFDRLSLYQLENRLIQDAIETTNRWLALNQLNESAYRRLMRLHFLNDDRSSALQVYEICCELLAKELGFEPSEETQEVWAYIRSSQAPAPVPRKQAEGRSEAFSIPFVGRSNEYQNLVKAFLLARAGTSQVVILAGESGIGKTRLSGEFLKWAGSEGADIVRGIAFETNKPLLYQPIIDALRERLERENAVDDLLDDVWLVELSRILPELRERYPDLALPSDDQSTARARLFEAIARLAEALSARRPLVWLMDDLQWADTETLELLRYLTHNWRNSHAPIMLLLLVRSETLVHGSALRDWMAALARESAVTRISLSPMPASDVQKLVQSLAGEDAAGTAELSAWFSAESAGQPFFLTETLSALDEYDALVWVQESSGRRLDPQATLANLKAIETRSLIPAIQDVVLSRLEWLSQPASALLAAAAVIGHNCSFESLCQISGISEQDSLDALDELLAARFIIEVKNEAWPYTIAHERTREIVYSQLSEARQQVFHQRALSALAKSKALPAELAQHALSAKEWQSAFQHSLEAGNEALRLYAVAGAIFHYETARRLLTENKVDVETETCQQLYTQLGRAYELEFQHRQAVSIYEEMQTQALARDSQEMELASLVARCVLLPAHYDTQDVELARDLAQKAVPLAYLLNDVGAQTQIELTLARTHKFGDRHIKPAIEHFLAAEKLASEAGLREQLAWVKLELGVAFISLGQLKQAESVLSASMEIFRELGQHPRVLSCLHNLAIIQMETGNFEAALSLLDDAYQENEALGSPTSIYALATTRNVIHILRGEYDRVFETLTTALELDENKILSGLWIDIYQQLAWCYYDLGAYDEGLVHCQNAISHHQHINSTGRAPAFAVLGLLQTRLGNLSQADAAIIKSWENFDIQWQTYAGWWETLSILEAEAELALAQGELARAARCTNQLLGKYEELNLRHLKPCILFLQARITLLEGDEEAAYQTLWDALALSDEMGAHREVWAMCSTLEKLETERGNESSASKLKERACTEVKFIAEHAGSPELRDIFLSRPDVQLVVGETQF